MKDPKIIRQLIGKNEYEFRIYETTFMVYRISKKAYWGMVGEWWYDYKGDQEILDHAISWFVAKVLAKEMAKEEAKKQRLAEQKKRREELAASIKVGDLFHRSWGYDMTHNDFYQVTAIKGKKIYARPIASEVVSWDAGYTGEERAVRDAFIWEEQGYILSPYGWIKVCDYDHAYLSEWDHDYYFNYVD